MPATAVGWWVCGSGWSLHGRTEIQVIEDMDLKASADPTKHFFVEMITRDITLEDSILDLIDNSIDSAWRASGSHNLGLEDETDLSEFSISIRTEGGEFQIKDNCGGMTLDDAINHAFSFGRRPTAKLDDYSIGVYGIGMKRAVFKIGRRVRIHSTVDDEDGGQIAFSVPIDVPKWMESDEPPWDFDIDPSEPQTENGVDIFVGELTAGAAASFENPAFLERLERTIARDYALHLERGLNVRINGEPITGTQIEFLQSDDFVPMRVSYSDTDGDEPVDVEIVGGMAAPPPEGTEPEDTKEREYHRFGWYVACNGRIVLAGDKTNVSGWGLPDWPNWHPQYSGFLGIVFFSASNASALPLTTTKRSVDVTSDIFLRARPRMRELTKKWTSYTNVRKQVLERAKEKERMARAVAIRDVARRDEVVLPRLRRPTPVRVANVHYSVPVVRMKRLAEALGKITMPYREVGLKSFDYTYEDLIGDE